VSVLPIGLVMGSDPYQALRATGAGANSGARGSQAQRAFVVAEIACAAMLLIAAGLGLKTARRLAQVDLGFDSGHLVQGSPSLPHGWRVKETFVPVTRRIIGALAAISGVDESVGVRAAVPLGPSGGAPDITLAGQATPLPSTLVPTDAVVVNPGYFRTLRIPVVQGRSFSERDREETVPVAIVNEWAATHWWPGRDPVGELIRVDTLPGKSVTLTIVGVARDNKAAQANLLLSSEGPELYRPYEQSPSAFPTFFVRASGTASTVIRPLSQLLSQMVPERPVSTQIVSDQIGRQLETVRTNALQILAFAATGLLLALVGIYGVLSYAVNRRMREFGIRRALGATGGEVRALVVRDAVQLTILGLLIGSGGAVFAERLVVRSLYGTSPTDPAVYLTIAAVVMAATVVSSLMPALRAARVSPTIALQGT
jgi:putative ABC transport system permease protein